MFVIILVEMAQKRVAVPLLAILRKNICGISSHQYFTQGWIQSSSSDLQKSLKFLPNLISQLFMAVHEIIYSSCFIVYYEIKQRRNYSFDHTANPASSRANLDESPFPWFRPLSILPRTTRKIFEGTIGQSFYLESGDWVYMDLFTNHSKPTSIGQNHSHCLANYSNSVMIGYSGRKLPCKLLTIIYKETKNSFDL